MVVNQVHVTGVVALKSERDAPVCTHRHRPVPAQVSFQWMKAEQGKTNVSWSPSSIQDGQNPADPAHKVRSDKAWVAVSMKNLQTLVPEAPDQRAAPA